MPLEFVTLTGADDGTSLAGLRDLLLRARPGSVELGVLHSRSRQGQPRYPTREQALLLIAVARLARQRVALHVCGEAARELASYHQHYLVERRLGELIDASAVDRVQVNLTQDATLELFGGPGLAELASQVVTPPRRLVLQWRSGRWPALPGCDLLYDCSAGRGRTPAAWPLLPEYPVGLAGGLGPGLVAPLEAMLNARQVEVRYWLDMESGLRTGNAFDLLKCEAVLRELGLLGHERRDTYHGT